MTETSPVTSGARPAQALGERLAGRVIRPGDVRYGAARTLWNAMIDHRPALIVQPRSADEVATAILYARDAGLEIGVRGGGHSIAGDSMSDGGMTIDLSALNRVVVDATARRARVGGGALLMDVATAAAPAGLAFPFGHVSHTGIGGLMLGGGIGWIMRKHGLAIDSLHSAELVTAEGWHVEAVDDPRWVGRDFEDDGGKAERPPPVEARTGAPKPVPPEGKERRAATAERRGPAAVAPPRGRRAPSAREASVGAATTPRASSSPAPPAEEGAAAAAGAAAAPAPPPAEEVGADADSRRRTRRACNWFPVSAAATASSRSRTSRSRHPDPSGHWLRSSPNRALAGAAPRARVSEPTGTRAGRQDPPAAS